MTAVEALCNVVKDMGAVAKSGTAPGAMGGYSFRKYDDVIEALHPLCAKHGLLVAYDDDEFEQDIAESGWVRTRLKVRWRFMAADGDSLEVCNWGEALDKGDKSLAKARTAALKDVLARLLTIPFGDADHDTESTDTTDAPPPRRSRSGGSQGKPSAKQASYCEKLLNEVVHHSMHAAIIEQVVGRAVALDDLIGAECSTLIDWLLAEKKAGRTPDGDLPNDGTEPW